MMGFDNRPFLLFFEFCYWLQMFDDEVYRLLAAVS